MRQKMFACMLTGCLAMLTMILGSCSSGGEETTGPGGTQTPEGMVLIPKTTFSMGLDTAAFPSFSDYNNYDYPNHQVTVEAFYIDKYEVTQAQYREFVLATGHRTPYNNGTDNDTLPGYVWNGTDYPSGKGNYPVIGVSLSDAEAYCQWRGKRLPTEAEWELAARGTDGRLYPWGNTFDASKCNVWTGGAVSGPTPVGSYPTGVSPYGCYDMAGNAQEITTSWLLPYPGHPDYGTVTTTTYKSWRGGSFDNSDSSDDMVSVVNRSGNGETRIDEVSGFRCVKDPD